MKYKLVFSYDGSKYFGYAIQKNEEHTIQSVVETAISTILNTPTKISASGRTDKGVHALNQVITFISLKKLDKDKFLHSLNKLVPNDIHFKTITKVKDDFDARLSAKSKIYEYHINIGEYDVFKRSYEIVVKNLDIKKMHACAKLFCGTHCFKNFTSRPNDEMGFIRTIYSIKFSLKENILIIEFKGNGFMTYMVRKLVGALISVGQNKASIDEIKNYLDKAERDIFSLTAAPNALFLRKVNY